MIIMKNTKCYGCNKTKKTNSRGYCTKCWNEHQQKVQKAKQKTRLPIRILKKYSLQGLKEQGY